MEYRLIYERMMLKAFSLNTRKEIYFADADFFDLQRNKELAIAMTAALCVFKNQSSAHKEWLTSAMSALASQPDEYSVICRVLLELPVEYQ